MLLLRLRRKESKAVVANANRREDDGLDNGIVANLDVLDDVVLEVSNRVVLGLGSAVSSISTLGLEKVRVQRDNGLLRTLYST